MSRGALAVLLLAWGLLGCRTESSAYTVSVRVLAPETARFAVEVNGVSAESAGDGRSFEVILCTTDSARFRTEPLRLAITDLRAGTRQSVEVERFACAMSPESGANAEELQLVIDNEGALHTELGEHEGVQVSCGSYHAWRCPADTL